jgi:putative glycosyltransferase
LELSIVTSLYYSAPYLEDFYARIKREAEKITQDFELIFVNDGSPDNSLDIVLSFYERDKRVKVIDLSRNFGQHKAIMTGLSHASGKWVFAIDCDLEEEPELLERFFMELKKSNADVAYGVQQTRKGGFIRRISGNIFYSFFNLLSSYPVPANVTNTRLMSKRYVAALVQHREREIFLAGLWAITGFKQVPVLVEKPHKGTTTYSMRRKISIFVNSITSFSDRPLIFIFYLGGAIALLAGIAAFYLLIRIMMFGSPLPGWPSLIVSVWLLGGLIILSLGIIGIYLSNIFMEAKQRPYTVIRQIYGRDQS